MTLARKIYSLMEIGKPYHIKEIEDMLYDAEREYIEEDHTLEEFMNEKWIEFRDMGYENRRKAIRDALKETRKFGYTRVNVGVTPAHNERVWHTGHYGHAGYYRTLHFDEFKEYTYIRVK